MLSDVRSNRGIALLSVLHVEGSPIKEKEERYGSGGVVGRRIIQRIGSSTAAAYKWGSTEDSDDEDEGAEKKGAEGSGKDKTAAEKTCETQAVDAVSTSSSQPEKS